MDFCTYTEVLHDGSMSIPTDRHIDDSYFVNAQARYLAKYMEGT